MLLIVRYGFGGTFEGNDHKISNLNINSTASFQGLFGMNWGLIKNVIIEGNVSSSGNTIGGLVACNTLSGEIKGCTNKSTVTGGIGVGGICGSNGDGGKVTNCCNKNKVTAVAHVGGISGSNQSKTGGTIDGCYNISDVTSTGKVGSGYSQAGGIVGNSSYGGVVFNCYNTGKVTGPYGESGGIVGCMYGAPTNYVTNCYNIGEVTSGYRNGSISGQNRYASLTSCYWTAVRHACIIK